MRNRSGIQGVASSPVIVGAVTVLVVIVAVFLAYNANNGLPFVSTYNLKARVPNANALVKGNEVRIGGARVGVVKSVVPVQTGDGQVAAELSLSLDKNVQPLPVNSTMIIRPKSPLGLKYVQIVPGDSSRASPPAKRSRSPPPSPNRSTSTSSSTCSTRRPGTRSSATWPASATPSPAAGRSSTTPSSPCASWSKAASRPWPTWSRRAPASANSGARWRRSRPPWPRSPQQQASMFVALDRTFAAFARVSRPYIQETISKGPETLDAATEDLPALRPFLHDSERFFTALKPGAKALGETSPTIAAALRAGIPVLNASPALNAQLPPTADALLAFQQSPGVFNGLDLLIDTNELLGAGDQVHRPGPDHLQLPHPRLPQPRQRLQRRQRRSAAGSTRSPSRRPEGPNSEGGPASAPANGGTDSPQPPALQPLPEHRLSRPAERVRGGQRALRSWA